MPANKYSDSLLMDALRGSLSNAESFGRGFGVAPVGLLGDINALAREYITPRLPANVQGLLQSMPSAPTTESILSAIPRMTAPRMESSGMEQIGAAANPRGPVNLGRAVASLPSDVARAGQEFLMANQPARMLPKSVAKEGNLIQIEDKVLPVTMHKLEEKAGNQIVNISPEAFDKAFSKTQWQYVGKGGEGGIEGRYKGFENWLKDAKSMTASNVSVNKDGGVVFGDGRHRYAVLRDMGLDKLPISMDAESIKNAKKFGYISDETSFQYPQEQALKLAQERAALPVEQGGLGLPPNNTPEMRAQAMGFNLETYHGTDAPNIESLDPKRTKIIEGVFSAFHPKTASMYAEGAAEKGRAGVESAPNVMPLLLNSPSHFQMPEFNKQMIDSFRNSGYAGVQRPEAGVAVTFDPAQIRSRFAAFDPFRKDVATATAMGVALPDLLAAEYNKQPQSAGLLYPLP